MSINVQHRDTVTARWFDVWASAVAVGAMCVARGYGGIATLPGGLSVTMDMVVQDVSVGNETAVS